MLKNKAPNWAVAVHAFNPSTREAEAGGSLSLTPAWSTRASSRTARTTQRNLSQKPKTKKQINEIDKDFDIFHEMIEE